MRREGGSHEGSLVGRLRGGQRSVLAVDGGAQVDAGAVFDLDGGCETKGINRGVAFDNALSFFIVDSTFVHGGIISNGGGGSAAIRADAMTSR